MELIAADKDTVTIKMSWKDEFCNIWAIFSAVYQEYDQLDPEIHNVTEEEVLKIKKSLSTINDQAPLANNSKSM